MNSKLVHPVPTVNHCRFCDSLDKLLVKWPWVARKIDMEGRLSRSIPWNPMAAQTLRIQRSLRCSSLVGSASSIALDVFRCLQKAARQKNHSKYPFIGYIHRIYSYYLTMFVVIQRSAAGRHRLLKECLPFFPYARRNWLGFAAQETCSRQVIKSSWTTRRRRGHVQSCPASCSGQRKTSEYAPYYASTRRRQRWTEIAH